MSRFSGLSPIGIHAERKRLEREAQREAERQRQHELRLEEERRESALSQMIAQANLNSMLAGEQRYAAERAASKQRAKATYRRPWDRQERRADAEYALNLQQRSQAFNNQYDREKQLLSHFLGQQDSRFRNELDQLSNLQKFGFDKALLGNEIEGRLSGTRLQNQGQLDVARLQDAGQTERAALEAWGGLERQDLVNRGNLEVQQSRADSYENEANIRAQSEQERIWNQALANSAGGDAERLAKLQKLQQINSQMRNWESRGESGDVPPQVSQGALRRLASEKFQIMEWLQEHPQTVRQNEPPPLSVQDAGGRQFYLNGSTWQPLEPPKAGTAAAPYEEATDPETGLKWLDLIDRAAKAQVPPGEYGPGVPLDQSLQSIRQSIIDAQRQHRDRTTGVGQSAAGPLPMIQPGQFGNGPAGPPPPDPFSDISIPRGPDGSLVLPEGIPGELRAEFQRDADLSRQANQSLNAILGRFGIAENPATPEGMRRLKARIDQLPAPAQMEAEFNLRLLESMQQGIPVPIRTIEEAQRLPSGTRFIDPNGIERRVP